MVCGREEIEELSTEIRNQGARNGALSRPDCAPCRLPGRPVEEAGRPLGRPACTTCTIITVDRMVDRGRERSTGPVDRLTGLSSQLGPVDRRGRPWHGLVHRSVDRQARFDFPFGIRISFLDEIESNLGFLKSRDCGYK